MLFLLVFGLLNKHQDEFAKKDISFIALLKKSYPYLYLLNSK